MEGLFFDHPGEESLLTRPATTALRSLLAQEIVNFQDILAQATGLIL
jgi:hypothetical protein